MTYLATPVRYRWMGITPTLPAHLVRRGKPDVAHVMGFRDPVTTGVAAWCRARGVPYVFEPVGMFRPRLRKVALKRAFDATIARGVAGGARLVVVSSERERDDVVACGVPPERIRLRGNALPRSAGSDRRRSARGHRPGGRAGRPLRRPDRRREGGRAPPRGRAPPARGPRRARRPRRPPRDDERRPRRARRPGDPRAHPRPPCRRPGRRTTSTAARTSSSSPRAARTSGSSPPRRPRSGRPWSSPTGPGSHRRSRRARRSSSRTTRTRRWPRSSVS